MLREAAPTWKAASQEQPEERQGRERLEEEQVSHVWVGWGLLLEEQDEWESRWMEIQRPRKSDDYFFSDNREVIAPFQFTIVDLRDA